MGKMRIIVGLPFDFGLWFAVYFHLQSEGLALLDFKVLKTTLDLGFAW